MTTRLDLWKILSLPALLKLTQQEPGFQINDLYNNTVGPLPPQPMPLVHTYNCTATMEVTVDYCSQSGIIIMLIGVLTESERLIRTFNMATQTPQAPQAPQGPQAIPQAQAIPYAIHQAIPPQQVSFSQTSLSVVQLQVDSPPAPVASQRTCTSSRVCRNIPSTPARKFADWSLVLLQLFSSPITSFLHIINFYPSPSCMHYSCSPFLSL